MGQIDDDLKGLPPSERTAIKGRLQTWATESGLGARVTRNLDRERFLQPSDRIDLYRVFLANASAPERKLRMDYVASCRRLSLRGGSVTPRVLPARIGRAVDKESLVAYLSRRYRSTVFKTKSNVERFVDGIVSARVITLHPDEKALLMSQYPAWATWNEHDPIGGNPFEFATPKRGDAVRASLGLAAKRKGRSRHLILKVYKRHSAATLYRPTVADAADYPYFEPSPRDDYGLTMPWPESEVDQYLPGYVATPRPEALHEPMPFELLEVCELWT